MSYADQRDAIAAHLNAIADIGLVHDRPRYGDAHEHWVTQIGGVDTIRAWEIGVDEPGIETERIQQRHRHIWRNWRIQGYLGLEDQTASYHTILNLAEQIADTLETDQKLTGPAGEFPAGTCLDHEPVQTAAPTVLTIGGGFLCWGITLHLRTLEVTAP